MIVLALLAASALATPSDVAITTAGAIGTWAPAAEGAEVDVLLGQRLRWRLSEAVRAHVDARFTLDPLGEDVLRWTQVRRLGASLEAGPWTVDLGRHPVRYGGPRLVDGAQAVVRRGALELGVWGGLAPDLFTTLPRLRYGGGPLVAVRTSAGQLAAVGEALLTDEGQLDRAAALATGRYTVDRLLDVSGRLDVEAVGEQEPHLSDARVLVVTRPGPLRVDALYNAFSSYRYLQTEGLDPDLKRFEQRTLDLGLDLGFYEETRDPSINHLVGGAVRWRGEGDLAPRALVEARYRFHPNPANRFARLHPQVALSGLPVGGRLEVALDGNLIQVDDRVQVDGGLIAVYEPTDDPAWIVDASGRLLVNPAYDGLGWYADCFVDWVLPIDLAIVAGVAATNEPYEDLPDLGVSGFLRLTKYLRR